MAGCDKAKILALPDTSGMKNEVLMLKAHRTLYDQAARLSGAVIREAGVTSRALPEEVAAAVTEKTALFLYVAECAPMRGSLALSETVPMLREKGVPVVVDMAGELPPREAVAGYFAAGADLLLISGGKELRGPQSSGLILGRRDLVSACRANCCPNYGVGRAMKIDKETIAGITRAVELFVEKDYEAEMARWRETCDEMARSISAIEGFEARVGTQTQPGIQPVAIPRVWVTSSKMTGPEMAALLRGGVPPIYTRALEGILTLSPQCLEAGEAVLVVSALSTLVK